MERQMTKLNRYTAHGRRFGRDERGSPAVEFALIAPVFMLFLFGIVQFGFAFFTYNDMFNGAREGARRLAVGVTESEAINRAEESMTLARNYSFVPASSSHDVTMSVTLTLADAMIISVIPLPDIVLTASATMRKEY